MAKLKNLYDKISSLREQLSVCNQAYIILLNKHRKLRIKYSYEETMEEVKRIDKDRNVNKKLIL